MPRTPSPALKRFVGLSAIFLATFATTSCESPRTVAPANSACGIFAPIYLDEPSIAGMTPRDKGQIAEHNAVYEKECSR